jgi:hypothetical protein
LTLLLNNGYSEKKEEKEILSSSRKGGEISGSNSTSMNIYYKRKIKYIE